MIRRSAGQMRGLPNVAKMLPYQTGIGEAEERPPDCWAFKRPEEAKGKTAVGKKDFNNSNIHTK